MTGLAFVNGTVITVDADFRLAEAVAVRDARIAAVGSTADVLAHAGPRARVVDLAGGAVLPGINDSHLHAAMLGAYWPNTWLAGMGPGRSFPTPRQLETGADRRAALRTAWDALVPLGITSYTEPGLGPGADGQHGDACGAGTLRTYAELDAAGELPLRVTVLQLFGQLDGPSSVDDLTRGLPGVVAGDASVPSRLRVAGVKLFADGIPPMRTAWMSSPYRDGGYGSLIVTGADDAARLANLASMIALANEAGLQLGIHATGSRAIAESVRVLAAMPAYDQRHYIIHGDFADAGTLRLMARHGIGLNAQPSIYAATAPMLAAAVEAAYAHEAVPVRSALYAGVRVCLSSDGPVVAPDWRASIATAVTRDDPERITIQDAIRSYTIWPAWQDHAERWKGSIEPGKVADLCVLARDPLRADPADLVNIDVTMTVVDGEPIYER